MTRAVAAFSVAAAIVAQAQQPTFRARVDLVQVDVVVVDAQGHAVHDLKASDFILRDRGKAQAIATFDEVRHERPSVAATPPPVRADVGDNQGAQAERLVVMVVDDLHIYKERTDRTKDIARKVLADLGSQASMAVLF